MLKLTALVALALTSSSFALKIAEATHAQTELHQQEQVTAKEKSIQSIQAEIASIGSSVDSITSQVGSSVAANAQTASSMAAAQSALDQMAASVSQQLVAFSAI